MNRRRARSDGWDIDPLWTADELAAAGSNPLGQPGEGRQQETTGQGADTEHQDGREHAAGSTVGETVSGPVDGRRPPRRGDRKGVSRRRSHLPQQVSDQAKAEGKAEAPDKAEGGQGERNEADAEWVRRTVAKMGPLSAQDRERLALLLHRGA